MTEYKLETEAMKSQVHVLAGQEKESHVWYVVKRYTMYVVRCYAVVRCYTT